MDHKKFELEVNTLINFFTLHCKDKHQNQNNYQYNVEYKDKKFNIEYSLCDDCHNLISYSFERLRECPHDIKPRCRKCPTPCYEKPKWKQVAKLMRYSGFKLGLLKVKKFLSIK